MYYLNQKWQPRTKVRPGWKRCEIKLGGQDPPAVDDFDKDDKATKHLRDKDHLTLSPLSKILTIGGLCRQFNFTSF